MDEADETLILVDPEDRELGQAGKLSAHRLGQRHRAISVCVFDEEGRMLLQRRAEAKYHSGGLWTNACCTHPRPGESVDLCARRRLREELGFECPLAFMLRTHYRADVGSNLVEDEVVHLFVGRYAGLIRPDPSEVAQVAWRSREDLAADVAASPGAYTVWFRHYLSAYGDALFARQGPLQAA